MSTITSQLDVKPAGSVRLSRSTDEGEEGFVLHCDTTYLVGTDRKAQQLPTNAVNALVATMANLSLSRLDDVRNKDEGTDESANMFLTAAYKNWFANEVIYKKGRVSEDGDISVKDSADQPIDPDNMSNLHNHEALWIDVGGRYFKKLVHPNTMLGDKSAHHIDSSHKCSLAFLMYQPKLRVEEDLEQLSLIATGQLIVQLCHHESKGARREVPTQDGEAQLTKLQQASDFPELAATVARLIQEQPAHMLMPNLWEQSVNAIMRTATPYLQQQNLTCEAAQHYPMASWRFGKAEPIQLTIPLPLDDESVRKGLANLHLVTTEIGELERKNLILGDARLTASTLIKSLKRVSLSFQRSNNLSNNEFHRRLELQTKQVQEVASQIQDSLGYIPSNGHDDTTWSIIVDKAVRKGGWETIQQLSESGYQNWSADASVEWVEVEAPFLVQSKSGDLLEGHFKQPSLPRPTHYLCVSQPLTQNHWAPKVTLVCPRHTTAP